MLGMQICNLTIVKFHCGALQLRFYPGKLLAIPVISMNRTDGGDDRFNILAYRFQIRLAANVILGHAGHFGNAGEAISAAGAF